MLSILLMSFYLEAGVLPRDFGDFQKFEIAQVEGGTVGNYVDEKYKLSIEDIRGYINLDINLKLYNIFFIEGSAKTTVRWDSRLIGFDALKMNFMLGAGFYLGDNFEIGFRHYCYHPIYAYSHISINPIISPKEGFCEELYIKFKATDVPIF